jgi:dUTPase
MVKLTKHDWHYLLGFGFLDYQHQKEGLFLNKPYRLKKMVDELSFSLYGSVKTSIVGEKGQQSGCLLIDDRELAAFLCENGITTPKRYMPSISEEYAWSFIAGYFDAYGELSFKHGNPRVFIQSPIVDVISFIAKQWQVNQNYKDKVLANGYKALDICGKMYENVSIYNAVNYNAFMGILNSKHKDVDLSQTYEYVKLHPNAIAPHKTYVTDSGYDLHVLEMVKLYTTPWGAPVYQGKTELAIKPIFGYAFDINGRSNLPKNGWVLLQGTGICDRSYTGGIEGTFMKLNDEPLPKMPWKALQLVPRDAPLHAKFNEKKDLGESMRSYRGFGSTNFKV